MLGYVSCRLNPVMQSDHSTAAKITRVRRGFTDEKEKQKNEQRCSRPKPFAEEKGLEPSSAPVLHAWPRLSQVPQLKRPFKAGATGSCRDIRIGRCILVLSSRSRVQVAMTWCPELLSRAGSRTRTTLRIIWCTCLHPHQNRGGMRFARPQR